MFGFSLGELIVVLSVTFLVLDHKDFLNLVIYIRKLIHKLETWYKDCDLYIKKIACNIESSTASKKDESKLVNHIIDLEGNIRKVYNLEKITPYIKPNNDKQ